MARTGGLDKGRRTGRAADVADQFAGEFCVGPGCPDLSRLDSRLQGDTEALLAPERKKATQRET